MNRTETTMNTFDLPAGMWRLPDFDGARDDPHPQARVREVRRRAQALREGVDLDRCVDQRCIDERRSSHERNLESDRNERGRRRGAAA